MKNTIQLSIWFLIAYAIINACAQRGTPTGGAKDVTPPKLIASYPDTLATNVDVSLDEIQIDFDEFITLKDYSKQIVISPPLTETPNFTPLGSPKKYVKIQLNSPLKENTTYSFSFNDAIQDFNENNKLSGFKYVFSTGEVIDSLQMSGTINNSYNKDLPKDIVVALYKIDSAYTDSLVLESKPYYVSLANEKGEYVLDYLHPGKYQMVAFNDAVPDLKYQPNQELIGFTNQPIELDKNTTQDLTLYPQSQQYQAKNANQIGYGHIRFRFNGKPNQVNIQSLDHAFKTKKILFQPQTDSLEFWFNQQIDSLGNKKSATLKFLVEHNNQTDTLKLFYKQDKVAKLSFTEANKGRYAPKQIFELHSNHPITAINHQLIKVVEDSTQIDFKTMLDDKNPQKLSIEFPIKLQKKYEIELLPNAITDFFNSKNDTLNYSFRVGDEKQYGNLKLKIENAPQQSFWLQLFDNQKNKIKDIYTKETAFTFDYLLPGEYTFRILVDENQNNIWDQADFFAKKPAEKVYHYPTPIDVRAYWNLDETWVLSE